MEDKYPEISRMVGGFKDEGSGTLSEVDASKVRSLGIIGAMQAREDLRYTGRNHKNTMTEFAAISPSYDDITGELRKFFVDPVVEVLPDVLRSSKLTLWTLPTLSTMDELYVASMAKMKGKMIVDASHIPPSPEFHIFDKAPLFKGGRYTKLYWGVDFDVAWYGSIALPLSIVGRDDKPANSAYPSNCIPTNTQAVISKLLKKTDGKDINVDLTDLANVPNYFELLFEGSRDSISSGDTSERSGVIIDLLMPLTDRGNQLRDEVITDPDVNVVRCPILSMHPYGPGDEVHRSPVLHYIYMKHFLRSKAAVLEAPKRKLRKSIANWSKKNDMPMHENGISVTCLRDVDLARKDTESRREHFKRLVEFSHRWQVSSHYRNQYYPSTGEHKRILIQPYVKGPKGTPLIKKTKVYKVTR